MSVSIWQWGKEIFLTASRDKRFFIYLTKNLIINLTLTYYYCLIFILWENSVVVEILRDETINDKRMHDPNDDI